MTYTYSVSRPQPYSAELVDSRVCRRIRIQVPSSIAVIDNSQDLENFTDSSLRDVQFFATGEAANALARQFEVRKVLVEQLARSCKEQCS